MNKNIDSAFYEYQSAGFISRTEEFDKAAITCKRLIKMSHKSYDSHYRWALIRRDQGEYRLAERKFREATILNPKDHCAFNNLGNTLSKQGKYDQAISSYKEGLKLSKDDLDLTHNIAICYTEKGDYKEAVKHYGKALEIQPSDPSTHNCIGYMHFLQGEYMKAIGKFHDAIQKDPQYEVPYFNKAMTLFCQSGKGKESKNAFELGIQALPALSVMKLIQLKLSVNVYIREMNRVRKELEHAENLGSKRRALLEKTQKGLEYILGLLRIEIEKSAKNTQTSPSTSHIMNENRKGSSRMSRLNCFKSCITSIKKRFS